MGDIDIFRNDDPRRRVPPGIKLIHTGPQDCSQDQFHAFERPFIRQRRGNYFIDSCATVGDTDDDFREQVLLRGNVIFRVEAVAKPKA